MHCLPNEVTSSNKSPYLQGRGDIQSRNFQDSFFEIHH